MPPSGVSAESGGGAEAKSGERTQLPSLLPQRSAEVGAALPLMPQWAPVTWHLAVVSQ